jgi:hypothetical protein
MEEFCNYSGTPTSSSPAEKNLWQFTDSRILAAGISFTSHQNMLELSPKDSFTSWTAITEDMKNKLLAPRKVKVEEVKILNFSVKFPPQP